MLIKFWLPCPEVWFKSLYIQWKLFLPFWLSFKVIACFIFWIILFFFNKFTFSQNHLWKQSVLKTNMLNLFFDIIRNKLRFVELFFRFSINSLVNTSGFSVFLFNSLVDCPTWLFSYYCFVKDHIPFVKSSFRNNFHLKIIAVLIITNFRMLSGINLICFRFVRIFSFPVFLKINMHQLVLLMSVWPNDCTESHLPRRNSV